MAQIAIRHKMSSSTAPPTTVDQWSRAKQDARKRLKDDGRRGGQDRLCPKIDEAKSVKKSDFGRPWSWVVMITCLTTTIIASGQLQSVNIYYLIFLKEFQQSSSFTAWISAAQTAARCVAGPLSSFLLSKLGARLTIFAGSFLMTSSFLFVFFANSVPHLIVVYACIGASESLLSGGNLMAINTYFPNRAAFVTGIMLAGGGLGTMLIGLEIEWAVQAFGWRGAMLLQAGIVLQACICGISVFQTSKRQTVAPPSDALCGVSNINDDGSRKQVNEIVSKLKTEPPSIGDRTSFRNLTLDPFFWLSVLSFVSLQASFSTMVTIFKGFVVSAGLESSFTTVLTTVAVGNTVGRVFSGPISGSICAPVYMAIAALTCAVANALYLLATVPWALAIVGGFYGFFQGQLFVSWLLCMSWVYGQDQMPVVRGQVMFFGAISSLLFPPLAGYTVDMTGNYNIALMMISAANVCLGICGLVTYFIHYRKSLPSPDINDRRQFDNCTHL